MKKIIHLGFQSFLLFSLCLVSISCHYKNSNTKINNAYNDAVYKGGLQTIPGKLECEYYDFGGEGISYHDNDTINSGSGNLNKGNDYLNTFRINEAVDISFTKFHDSIDNSKFNMIQPKEGQLYLGWTEPGEWTKYTVNVQKSGIYQISLMYTSNQNGQISIETAYKNSSGVLNVKSTYDAEDPIQWRQWHHWNYDKNIGKIKLKKGIQTITLHTVAVGQMNYDFIAFDLISE